VCRVKLPAVGTIFCFISFFFLIEGQGDQDPFLFEYNTTNNIFFIRLFATLSVTVYVLLVCLTLCDVT
jgi:hypothetical protein